MNAFTGRGARLLTLVFTVCFFTVSFVSGLSFEEGALVTESGLPPEFILENDSSQASQILPDQSDAAAADTSFMYDANGNLVNGKGLSYVYDDANHLSEVRYASNNTLLAKYFYDDTGNRVKKVSGGFTTYYVGNYLETRIQGTQRKDTSYYFANTEREARKDPDGSKYYYHRDHLGSTSIVTNGSGSVVESVAYLPFGEIQSKTGSGSTYLYTDQELDDESGLYYYDARYYSPEMMRFVEPDSIIQDVYNPQNLNRYSYVLNNPIKYNDPTGNFIFIPVLFAAVVVGGLLGYGYLYMNRDEVRPDLVTVLQTGFIGGTAAAVGCVAGLAASSYVAGSAATTSVTSTVAGSFTSGYISQLTENTMKILGSETKLYNKGDVPSNVLDNIGESGLFSTAGGSVMRAGGANKIVGAVGEEVGGTLFAEGLQLTYDSLRPKRTTNFPSVSPSTLTISTSSSGDRASHGNSYTPLSSGAGVTGGSSVGSSGGTSASTKPQYGYNPHKYPWDSSPLRGWD